MGGCPLRIEVTFRSPEMLRLRKVKIGPKELLGPIEYAGRRIITASSP